MDNRVKFFVTPSWICSLFHLLIKLIDFPFFIVFLFMKDFGIIFSAKHCDKNQLFASIFLYFFTLSNDLFKSVQNYPQNCQGLQF